MVIDELVTTEIAKTICKLGQGVKCCRYLTMSAQGWSCEKHTSLKYIIDRKVLLKIFTARSDNCDGRRPRPVEQARLVK